LVSTARVLQNKTALATRERGKNLKNHAEIRRSAKVGLGLGPPNALFNASRAPRMALRTAKKLQRTQRTQRLPWSLSTLW